MKTTIAAGLILAILAPLAGCQDASEPPTAPTITLAGAHDGLYTRIDGYSTADPTTTTGEFRLLVSGPEYTLESEARYAPPGGRGLVTVGEHIAFDDQARHTAEFDHTLIIEGEFAWWEDGDRLVLEQYDPARDRLVRLELTERRTR